MDVTLYPFQEKCVEFHLAHHYTLNCCEMGLGKTLVALEAAKRTALKTLVVGPAFLEGVWKRESEVIGIEVDFISYSVLHRAPPSTLMQYGFVIAEEVHYLKTPTTKRTHAFYDLIKGVKPPYFVGLTGTPIKNRLPDFWTLLAFCNFNPQDTNGLRMTGEYKSYHRFARHFCHMTELNISNRRIPRYGAVKDVMIPELKALLKDKMIRFTVEQVLNDLPEITRQAIPIPLSIPGDASLLEIFKEYTSGRKADISAKVRSAYLKAPSTAMYCKELSEGGSGPLLIFTDHIESGAYIAKDLGAEFISGSTPSKVRIEIAERFQRGDMPYLVATIGSMSVGHTLTAAKHVIFNDLSWVPADNLQAEKRIHRIGQKSVCFAHYVESTPTDSYIRKTLFTKMDTVNKVLQ
jgi:SWI/SNF-related matrix-associated actin-dependent regulator 1 of chromatin subfamily A